MRKKWLIVLLLLFLSGCTDAAPDGFNIGLIAPLTGEQAAFGNHCLYATQLAIHEINSKGGINAQPVKLCVMDDRGDVLEGITCFYRMAAEDVDAVIGGVTSSVAVGLTRAANETGIPLLSPSATADIVDTQDDYVFRACFTDSFQGAAAARFLHRCGITRVAVLYAAGDAYSCGLKDAFCLEATRLGIKLLGMTAAASMAEVDYTPALLSLLSEEPQALYAPLYYSNMGLYVLPQLQKLGFDGLILGGDAYDGIDRYVSSSSLLEHVVFTNHYDKNATVPYVTSFVNAYTEQYGKEKLGSFAALTYDCVYMLKKAAEADTTLKEALGKLAFSGVTGSFSMGETGTPEKTLVVIGFHHGEEILVDKE